MGAQSQLDRMGRGRRTALVLILSGLWVVGPFADDMYLPAMPDVSRDLGTSMQAVALTITTFIVGLAVGQLLTAPLSDSRGRKGLLLAGLAVFAATSLASALAPTIELLVAVRFAQGVSGAAGMAIANAVVTDVSHGRQAARLLSRMTLVGGLAPVVAPLIGAQLLHVMSWRGLFGVVAVLSVGLLAAVAFGLPETHPRERRTAGGLRVVAGAMATLSRDAGFMGYTLAGALTSMAFFAYIAGSSFVYQDVYGVSATAYGLLFGLNAVGMLSASALNHRLLGRFSPRLLLTTGLAIAAAAGVVTLAVLAAPGLGIWALVAPLFVTVSVFGAVWPDSTALALTRHPRIAGSASAYNGTLRLGFGALATPLVGLGGQVSGLSMGLVMAASCVAALPLYALVVRRAPGGAEPGEDAAARGD